MKFVKDLQSTLWRLLCGGNGSFRAWIFNRSRKRMLVFFVALLPVFIQLVLRWLRVVQSIPQEEVVLPIVASAANLFVLLVLWIMSKDCPPVPFGIAISEELAGKAEKCLSSFSSRFERLWGWWTLGYSALILQQVATLCFFNWKPGVLHSEPMVVATIIVKWVFLVFNNLVSLELVFCFWILYKAQPLSRTTKRSSRETASQF